ncbi:general transcription factor IIIC polypeptide 3 GTF3C3 [Toxoplasma gondii MAS]|uniref:General transcription factor IIIC polypeptide 3 GTF3C3 n=1 Tax=Toxoplasma gondii MAS TaxID=943118 RepID=A0A086QYM6_TOXGO|nr:general transcription factor IIIC polypeptide 3 GTF3C3 [Toxoplasma gondii MAS]
MDLSPASVPPPRRSACRRTRSQERKRPLTDAEEGAARELETQVPVEDEGDAASEEDDEDAEDFEEDDEDDEDYEEDDEDDEDYEEEEEKKGRRPARPHGRRSSERVSGRSGLRGRAEEASTTDKGTEEEMHFEDDEDPFGGAGSSEPEDDNDSDWLREEETDDLHSESSIAESEMEEYFMREDETEDEGKAAAPGSRRRKGRRKRKRAEPFSGVTTQRKRRRKRTAATPSEMPPALKKLMGEATDAYLREEFEKAVQILEDIVRQAPGLHDPFHLLGLIYEEAFGDKRRAVDFYLLAAHLVVPGDPELWRHIGSMSVQLGNLPQAIYCFRRCLRNASNAQLSAACSAGFRPDMHLPPVEEKEKGDSEDEPDVHSGGDRGRRRERRKKGKEKPPSMEEEIAFSLATCHQQMVRQRGEEAEGQKRRSRDSERKTR